MTSEIESVEGVFELGDLPLESGALLRSAKIAYKTHGQLNADKTNAILYPTPFGAQHNDVEWIIGRGRALDPSTHFIVVLDQLGNGLSSSPSNTPAPQERAHFPAITILDDVTAQHRLVTERFEVRRIALVIGFSMGAQQTFQWAASHPDLVERIAPFCGTAKTTAHNAVFLDSLETALSADAAWRDGDYDAPPVRGLRAFARVYAAWGCSQAFYKRELYRDLGFTSREAYVASYWDQRYLKRDANNLLSMLRTWRANDLGRTPGCDGDHARALRSIAAKATVMASQTDLYFTPEDVEADASAVPGAQFRVIPSLWGHAAGGGANPSDARFIEAEIRALLAR
jgi:homoserine O-acetyltransferase